MTRIIGRDAGGTEREPDTRVIARPSRGRRHSSLSALVRAPGLTSRPSPSVFAQNRPGRFRNAEDPGSNPGIPTTVWAGQQHCGRIVRLVRIPSIAHGCASRAVKCSPRQSAAARSASFVAGSLLDRLRYRLGDAVRGGAEGVGPVVAATEPGRVPSDRGPPLTYA